MDCKLRAKNCGGCPMLGMDYAAQLKQKEETVKKLLGRFGPVEHIRGMETPYHYRNKVISTFTTGWGGKLTSGIYAANSHKVLPVESAFEACASVQVSAAQAARFANGGALSLDRLRQPVPGTVRVYAPDGRFLGLGRPSDGELKIVKLF